MEYKSMPKPSKRYQRGLRASAQSEGEFVELLNKEIEELLKNYENIQNNNKNNKNME